MAYFYMDTDAGSDANNGTTWALANLTLEGLLADMSAGDTGFIQGTATDTAAISRVFTSTGTVSNPCKIIGVKNGTTNVGASIVVSDMTIRGTDTLPHIEVTGAGNDMDFDLVLDMTGLKFTCPDRFQTGADGDYPSFTGCELAIGGVLNSQAGFFEIVDCEIEATSTGFTIWTRGGRGNKAIQIHGGVFTFTAAPTALFGDTLCERGCEMIGVDLGGFGNNTIIGTGAEGDFIFKNCKVPTTFTKISGAAATRAFSLEFIGCSDDTTLSATSSIQGYSYSDAYGSVVNESTIVRTGGADDGATGLFSYALTPYASTTLEGSRATIKSPWLSVWLSGGANTLTVYIANSSASTDYNQDEAWVEFYTPDAGDTAQHDQSFNPSSARLLDSSTAITDDTGSTWGTGGNNHQKFSTTVTTGFEGFAYARLHVAKRQATPDTVYLDPAIAVT